MIALLKKEINQFFSSLSATLTILIFLLVNSLFLWIISGNLNILDFGYANMDSFFLIAPIISDLSLYDGILEKLSPIRFVLI